MRGSSRSFSVLFLICTLACMVCSFEVEAQNRRTKLISDPIEEEVEFPDTPIDEPLPRGDNPEYRDPPDDEPLADVRIEGNKTILSESILARIKTVKGRVPSSKQVREDERALYRTQWFLDVAPVYRQTEEGLVLVFKVRERPVVRKVQYVGNSDVEEKRLKEVTGLDGGSPFSVAINREAARQIEKYYHERGYPFATCKLTEGGDPKDRNIIFKIDEGAKVFVDSIQFDGNQAFSSQLLRTKLETSVRKLGLYKGEYDPSTIRDDIASLKSYYHALGYFNVAIKESVRFSDEYSPIIKPGARRISATITYHIDEGKRAIVRKIVLPATRAISSKTLREGLQMQENTPFNARDLRVDLEKLRDLYGEKGRILAKIEAKPVYLDDEGKIDIAYSIDEDRPRIIRRIDVLINGEHPRTKESVVMNRLLFAPGDMANAKLIEKSRRRLAGSGLFANDLMTNNVPRIDTRIVEDEEVPSVLEEVFRGQNDYIESPAQDGLRPSDPQGDPYGDPYLSPPPLPEDIPGFIDILPEVSEMQTGRIMFGAGFNSDAGVVGSAVLEESNFDITRPPSSFREFINGTAFRGGGQQFRAEAVPGDLVSRYLVSWRDPYFLDSDFSLGVSGFYFTRIYQDWHETRGGGRVSVGKQFSPFLSGTITFRGEDVELNNARTPTPGIVTEALGHSLLSSVRLALQHDTRDNFFIPSEGHFVELGYEHAFGDFEFPRADLEVRQYFNIWERLDGEGRHTLSLRGQVSWTGEDTPVFERLFAGGIQSFRGFDFRGISPREGKIGIGGEFMFLGGAEYMFPLTADENFRGVLFTDFGSVEQDVSLDNFRLSAGAGLRITIPAMGPVPLAFDFAWPIIREEFDDERIFSFYVGITR